MVMRMEYQYYLKQQLNLVHFLDQMKLELGGNQEEH
jgi:hypothetical protein